MADEARQALLQILSDGGRHSGAALGQRLGCSRAAVWKQVEALRQLGLPVAAEPGQGYRLSRPVDLLSVPGLLDCLEPATRDALQSLEILLSTPSTSDRVAAMPPPAPGLLRVCLAEHQTAGRGRRGRRWVSPLGSGICLSVAWTYEIPPPDLGALGLVAGLAVTAALGDLGYGPLTVKWPNDVMTPGGKLAGILVDVAGEAGGPLRLAIGIGLNVSAMDGHAARVAAEGGAAPASLDQLAPAGQPRRNQLAASLLAVLRRYLTAFASGGFAPFAGEFARQDHLLGRLVSVNAGMQRLEGTARGIAADGALLVDVRGHLERVVAGDVTLRSGP